MKLKSFLGGCLTATIVLAGTAYLLHKCQSSSSVVETKETTEIIRDTIPVFYSSPIPKDSTVIRYETITVPIADTTKAVDKIQAEIPITQKMYKDSTYQAWVSGYNPSLDSIKVFQPVTTINRTITNTEVRYKTKRWGVGIQAGIGITPTKIEPYLGVGVTYTIFSW